LINKLISLLTKVYNSIIKPYKLQYNSINKGRNRIISLKLRLPSPLKPHSFVHLPLQNYI